MISSVNLKSALMGMWLRARESASAVVCRFKGHHYDTPVFHANRLYFCARCGHELLGRTFADLEPVSASEAEDDFYNDHWSQP